MSEVKNILLVGGTGWLGSLVAHALLDKKVFNVKLLVRPDSIKSKAELIEGLKKKGAVIVEGDSENLEQATNAAKGCDTVLSLVSGATLFSGKEEILFNAAKAAGVKRFVPSQYGIDTTKAGYATITAEKEKLLDKIKASGVEWTQILTGFFYEFWYSEATGFDWKNHKAVAIGNDDIKASATAMADIAKFIPEILLDPKSKNAAVHVCSSTHSSNEAIKIFEEVSGKKFEVTHKSTDQIAKDMNDNPAAYQIKFQYYTLTNQPACNFTDYNDSSRYNVKVTSLKEYAQQLYGKK